MTTIFHTADVHLDRAYAGAGMTASVAALRRQELRDAFRRFVDLALASGADVVTIGGDLYEHERSSLDTGHFLRQQFERLSPVPVLIAPGNHDYLAPDSLYQRVEWPSNVVVFREPRLRPVEAAGVKVWGAAHTAPDVRDNLLEGFRAPAQGTHILLFHGSDLSAVPDGKRAHCGFYPEDVARTGAAFALLGHYHSARVHERYAYPGSLEALDFSEAGPHYALRLEVSPGGVSAQLAETGRVRYVTRRLDVSAMTTSEELRAGIAALADGEAIMRVVLEGDLSPEIDLDVRALYNACAERFAYLDIANRSRPGWRLDEIAEESTTKGAFVRLMQAQIDATDGAEAELARLALSLGLQAFDRREVTVP